jgi:phosphopantothenoylcysteine decarboxylase/phosphopantothenate--cysteine ligase
VVVTAGPTREWLDDVRFLTNASTGQMGISIARAARARGAEVTLVLGPTHLAPPRDVTLRRVVTTKEMAEAAAEAVAVSDLVVFAAAPSDFRPAKRRRGKPPREGGAATLELVPTKDVAKSLRRGKGSRVHVGFALEVDGGVERAMAKMKAKRFDAIVFNTPANFGRGGGVVAWIEKGAAPAPLPSSTKTATARAIVARAWRLLDQATATGERRPSSR